MNNKYTSSSPVRGFRGLFRPMICTLAALMVASMSGVHAAPVHEVMVTARVTPEGRQWSAPTPEHPGMYLMPGSAARDFGPSRVEPQAANPESVWRDVRRSLRTNHYLPADGSNTPAANLILVFHWGVASPLTVETGHPGEELVNLREMLGVLGGPALDRAVFSGRDDLFAAAREERYYLIVSAYEIVAGNSPAPGRRLLWRTHASVPAVGLSQAQAVPLLCAAGAALFGRETPSIRKIAIEAVGTLVLAKK